MILACILNICNGVIMPLLDFTSLVISNDDYSLNSLRENVEFFHDIGIKKFIVTYSYNPSSDSNRTLYNGIRAIKENISTIRPRGAKIKLAVNVYLSSGASYNPMLKKLSFENSDKIFVQLPLFVDNAWLPQELNFLLYKQKLTPVFTSFEKNLISCDYEFASQLYKIQKSVFCLDLNYITSVNADGRVRQAMGRNTVILPSITDYVHSYYPIVSRFQILRERFGDKTYLRFCKYINDVSNSFFNIM